MWICPICHAPLAREENQFRCPNGHAYDIAREGYVHLLPAGRKAAGAAGDTREMVLSRRRFLDRGYYAPLSDAINQIAAGHGVGHEGRLTVLDAGCGEGYYLGRLWAQPGLRIDGFGMDVSKEAVRLAAGKYRESLFCVGSIHKLIPLADASADVLLNVFAPRDAAEFARVLRPEGVAVVVIPTSEHLARLHALLDVPPIKGHKAGDVVTDLGEAFRLRQSETLQYQRTLPAEDIRDLIRMTPAYWRISEEAWASAQAFQDLEIGFGFTVLALEKQRNIKPGPEEMPG